MKDVLGVENIVPNTYQHKPWQTERDVNMMLP